MKAQSPKMSIIETATNVVVGLATSFAVQWLVFPWFGIYVSHSTNAGITAIFFVASLIRSYTIRRIFNRLK